MKKRTKIIIATIALVSATFVTLDLKYQHDKSLYEPKLWIGLFNYRLNFRDVGESLNQCMKKDLFAKGMIYRSNKYFSGWSCDKINNPDKIYSLNFSPKYPHAYYCIQKNNTKLYGFHPNRSFEIHDIEDLNNWNIPEFKKTMCIFFNSNIDDIIQKKSFLYHCDIGRDRTGAYTAMLSMMLSEQKKLNKEEIKNAIECDYEKTHSLEKSKIGKMYQFMNDMEQSGGVTKFIQKNCNIPTDKIQKAAGIFIKPLF